MRKIAYFRVSTRKQGASGLGLEAQRQAVQNYCQGPADFEFVEVESGTLKERPQLAKALEACREHKGQLVIARLDRLSRNAAFLLGLQDAKVPFVCCDMPHADKFTVGIMALVAQKEAEMISARTSEALQAAKRRGVKLGNPRIAKARKMAVACTRRKAADFAAQLKPVTEEIKAAGVHTLKGIARCLNARGIRTPQGKSWTRQAVARIQKRLS